MTVCTRCKREIKICDSCSPPVAGWLVEDKGNVYKYFGQYICHHCLTDEEWDEICDYE